MCETCKGNSGRKTPWHLRNWMRWWPWAAGSATRLDTRCYRLVTTSSSAPPKERSSASEKRDRDLLGRHEIDPETGRAVFDSERAVAVVQCTFQAKSTCAAGGRVLHSDKEGRRGRQLARSC